LAVILFCVSGLGALSLPLMFEGTVRAGLLVIALLPFFWVGPTAYRLLTGGGHGSEVRGLVMRGIEGIAVYNGSLAVIFGSVTLGGIALGLILPGRWVGRWFYGT